MAYIGNSPGVASQRVVSTFTATSGQTTFTATSGYTIGYLDVYLNGIKLVNGSDYTAADGVQVVLSSGALLNDTVELVAFIPRGLTDGYMKTEIDARYGNVDNTSDASKNAATVILTNKTLTNPAINGFTGNTADINIGSGQIVKDTVGRVAIGSTEAYRAKFSSWSDFGTQGTQNYLAHSGNGSDGRKAGYSFQTTFIGVADTVARRSADIWQGYSTAAWGTEYLAFGVGIGVGVGVGAANDAGVTTTERMRIKGDGNVNIGPIIPVLSTSPTRTYLTLVGNGTGGIGVLQLTSSTGAATNQGNIEWHDIGNTGSTSTRTVYISAGAEGATATNLGSYLTFATKPDGVSSAGVSRLTIKQDGKVGIGTGTPYSLLEVNGIDTAITISGGLGSTAAPAYTHVTYRGYTGNRTAQISSFDQSQSTAESGGLIFFTNSNMAADTIVDRMRIDGQGKVSIGSTLPYTKLHIYGAGTTQQHYTNGDASGATLYLQDSGGAGWNGGQILFGAYQGVFAGIKGSIANGNGPAGTIQIQTRGTSGNVNERVRVDEAGNVQIHTGQLLALSNVFGYGAGAGMFIEQAVSITEPVTANKPQVTINTFRQLWAIGEERTFRVNNQYVGARDTISTSFFESGIGGGWFSISTIVGGTGGFLYVSIRNISGATIDNRQITIQISVIRGSIQ